VRDAEAEVHDAEVDLRAVALLAHRATAEAGRLARQRAARVAVVEAHALVAARQPVAVLHVAAVVAEAARTELGDLSGARIIADGPALLLIRDVTVEAGVAGVGRERRARLAVAAHEHVVRVVEADLRVAAAAIAGLVVVLAAD